MTANPFFVSGSSEAAHGATPSGTTVFVESAWRVGRVETFRGRGG